MTKHYIHISITKEQQSKVRELRSKLGIPKFNEVFLRWIDKLITEIELKDLGDGVLYVIN